MFRRLTVAENILAILELRDDLDGKGRCAELEALLDELQVGHVATQKGASLSGGERRRVEIAAPSPRGRATCCWTSPSPAWIRSPWARSSASCAISRSAASACSSRTTMCARPSASATAPTSCRGAVLAKGAPAAILANQRVRDVYLGKGIPQRRPPSARTRGRAQSADDSAFRPVHPRPDPDWMAVPRDVNEACAPPPAASAAGADFSTVTGHPPVATFQRRAEMELREALESNPRWSCPRSCRRSRRRPPRPRTPATSSSTRRRLPTSRRQRARRRGEPYEPLDADSPTPTRSGAGRRGPGAAGTRTRGPARPPAVAAQPHAHVAARPRHRRGHHRGGGRRRLP